MWSACALFCCTLYKLTFSVFSMKIPVFRRCVEQLLCRVFSWAERGFDLEFGMLHVEFCVVVSFRVYRLICL
jgi:hypothetical protein